MFDFPNSSAMDATASSGGPGTFLFQIVTGQPQQIQQHSTNMLTKATQFISLMNEFTNAAEQLSKVWSGSASTSAVKKITTSLQSFEKIIKVIQNASKLLGLSGTLVDTAQNAYRGVVGSVNPTVAGLMSNPWTYSAAVALSTATSASLRAFIMGIEGLLQGIGYAQLGAEIAALAQIVMEIEQLAKGPSAAAATSVGSVPTVQSISAAPITAPLTPPPVATAAGQQAAQNGVTNYTPPALAAYTQPAAPGTGAGAALGQLNGFGVPGASAAGTIPGAAGAGAVPSAIPGVTGANVVAGSVPSSVPGTYPSAGAGAALGQLNGFGVPGASAAGTIPGAGGASAVAGGVPSSMAGNYPSSGAIAAPGVLNGLNSGSLNSGSLNSGSLNSGGLNSGGLNTGGLNTGGLAPTTGGLAPSIDPSNSWIAVDPSNTAAGAAAGATPATPAAPPVGTGQDVSVTTTDHGITTTVSVPAGQAANINLDMTVNNDHVSEHLNIGADGSVTVS
jgi:hypothetical protein